MSELEKRKKAAEAKFAVSEELLFQAIVKRDRIVSKWIANNLLSMNENDTNHFIESAVKANLASAAFFLFSSSDTFTLLTTYCY